LQPTAASFRSKASSQLSQPAPPQGESVAPLKPELLTTPNEEEPSFAEVTKKPKVAEPTKPLAPKASKPQTALSDLAHLADDTVLAVTLAHNIRAKRLTKLTLANFTTLLRIALLPEFETTQLDSTIPEILQTLVRVIKKTHSSASLESWLSQDPLPHADNPHMCILHDYFLGPHTPAESEDYRLDNCLIRYSFVTMYAKSVPKEMVTPFHTSIKVLLSDRDSDKLYNWLTANNRDNKKIYQNDPNFVKDPSNKQSLKSFHDSKILFSHSCPNATTALQTMFEGPLPTAIDSLLERKPDIYTPDVKGYTNTELLTELFKEFTLHYPNWMRPSTVISHGQTETISDYLKLNLKTKDLNKLLWTLNEVLPHIKQVYKA
jgi:hypothetical protein